MGKLQIFDILLDHPQAVFHPGQTVSGRVIVELSEEMKMRGLRLKFYGGANVHWSERHTTGTGKNKRTVTRHYRSSQQYFNMTAVLYGKAEGQSGPDPMHPPGNHVYTFQFMLPQNLPSSFEGMWGHIRYWLQATIDKPWKFDHHCKKPFTVLSQLDLNLQPNINVQQCNQDQETLCCLCFRSGPISATLQLDRKGYVPGEFVTVYGEVTNHSNRVMNSSSIQLRMVTVFRATTKSRNHVKTLARIQAGEINPGDTQTWNGERLYIPPLPPSMLPNCDIILIFYSIVMVVDPSGPSFDLEVPIEIIIGTIPLQNVPYVFASAPSNYTLPFYNETNQPGDYGSPPPPVVPEGGAVPSAPPPSYQECVMGKVDVKEEEDNEYMRGETNWAPRYPVYSWGNPQV